jgi:hypothetical protein
LMTTPFFQFFSTVCRSSTMVLNMPPWYYCTTPFCLKNAKCVVPSKEMNWKRENIRAIRPPILTAAGFLIAQFKFSIDTHFIFT